MLTTVVTRDHAAPQHRSIPTVTRPSILSSFTSIRFTAAVRFLIVSGAVRMSRVSRGEASLTALAYNPRRVLNIVGFVDLMVALKV